MPSSPVWTAPTVDRRDDLPAATERESLDLFLDRHRETLLWKCRGLTGEQLASRPLATTSLSLLGLLRHMALVERWWFRVNLDGDTSLEEIHTTEDNPNGDFDDGTAASAEADYGVFLEEVDLARRAVVGRGLDETVQGRGASSRCAGSICT